jgi:arylsulfatase A-like enzyme
MAAKLTRCSLPLLALFVARGAAAPAPARTTRHIVHVMADDLGFNEMGFNNATRGLQTPFLDALAAGGVVLDKYYTNPLCSPTRSALMTGRYNHRLGTQANVVYWDVPWALPTNVPWLPAVLKARANVGATGMFGKSHLGSFRNDSFPSARGFDVFAGYLQGCGSRSTHVAACCAPSPNPQNDTDAVCGVQTPIDFRGYDWFENNVPALTANHVPSVELIASHAEAFIAQHAADAASFYLYLPFQNIHDPYDCNETSFKRFAGLNVSDEQRTMFGYIYDLDLAVGRVVAALARAGLRPEDTVIIFTSDNGAPPADGVNDRNYPLRGFKADTYEGGTNVPAFVHAPGLLPAGQRRRGLVHVTDWLPTLLSMLGATAPAGLDGLDVMPTLLSDAPVRGELVVNLNPLCNGGQFGSPKAGFVLGDLKLLCWCYEIAGIANGTATSCTKTAHADFPQLYNLTADPGETTNLAASQPADLARLEARLAELAVASVEPMQWDPPFQGPNYECANCPLHPAGTGPEVPWTAWIPPRAEAEALNA